MGTINGSLDNREMLRVHGSLKQNVPSSFLTWDVPYPDKIHPIRFIEVKVRECCAPEPLPASGFVPLGHIFEYSNVDPSSVHITDEKGSPVPIPPLSAPHFHLFVEPDPNTLITRKAKTTANAGKVSAAPHDPDAAMAALLRCYDNIPQFRLYGQEGDCVQLSNTLEFADDLREQFSLFEWLGGCREGSANAPQATATVTAHECPNVLVLP
jgi:hypothetical protein